MNDIEIEVVTEEKLLDELVDFTDYKRNIIRKYEKEEISKGYPLTINDVYVEPSCKAYDVEKKQANDIESIEQYMAEWLNDEAQHKQLALLGDYGMGKSVLSLRLAYLLLTGQIESKRIPIIIELRGRYIKQYNDTKEILNSWANTYNIPPLALQKLLYAGRLLLIFEGFDELDLIGEKQIRKEHFRKLWEFSIPNSKIIITGRPNYFIDDNEMVTLLRLSQRQAEGSKYCETITLRPFSREQIISAMRRVEPQVSGEIVEVYDKQAKDSSFIDLVSRPSSLFFTGQLWKTENLSQKVSNINSAGVIHTYLNNSYKRQDEKDDKSQRAIMNSEERAYFMQGIAIATVERHGYTNQINARELEEITEKLFLTFPDEITRQNVKAGSKLLKNRLDKDQSLLLPTIISDIRSCGVLVKDFSRENSFCFAHKSFLEVLIANFISESYLMKAGTTDNLRYTKVKTMINTNLHAESALQQIWPTSVYKIIENTAIRYATSPNNMTTNGMDKGSS